MLSAESRVIGSKNDLSSFQHQTNDWTNADILKFVSNAAIFYHKYAFENVLCKISAIMFQSRCFNILPQIMFGKLFLDI